MDSLSIVFKEFLISMGFNESDEELEKVKKKLLDQLLACDYPMVSGADKLVSHLHKNNIPMAIATNGGMSLATLGTSQTIGLKFERFSHIIGGADDPEVKNNKPAPDVYLVCAKRFNPPPKSLDSCVVFEDSLRGITGAVNTGMKTVLINEQPIVKSDEIANRITVIVDSFDNFKPESVGLPPY